MQCIRHGGPSADGPGLQFEIRRCSQLHSLPDSASPGPRLASGRAGSERRHRSIHACPTCCSTTSWSIAGVPERAQAAGQGTCRRIGPVRSRAGVPARPRLRRRRSARSLPPRWRQSPAPGPPLGRLRMSRCASLQGPLPGVGRAAFSSPRSMLATAEDLAPACAGHSGVAERELRGAASAAAVWKHARAQWCGPRCAPPLRACSTAQRLLPDIP